MKEVNLLTLKQIPFKTDDQIFNDYRLEIEWEFNKNDDQNLVMVIVEGHKIYLPFELFKNDIYNIDIRKYSTNLTLFDVYTRIINKTSIRFYFISIKMKTFIKGEGNFIINDKEYKPSHIVYTAKMINTKNLLIKVSTNGTIFMSITINEYIKDSIEEFVTNFKNCDIKRRQNCIYINKDIDEDEDKTQEDIESVTFIYNQFKKIKHLFVNVKENISYIKTFCYP